MQPSLNYFTNFSFNFLFLRLLASYKNWHCTCSFLSNIPTSHYYIVLLPLTSSLIPGLHPLQQESPRLINVVVVFYLQRKFCGPRRILEQGSRFKKENSKGKGLRALRGQRTDISSLTRGYDVSNCSYPQSGPQRGLTPASLLLFAHPKFSLVYLDSFYHLPQCFLPSSQGRRKSSSAHDQTTPIYSLAFFQIQGPPLVCP